MDFVSGPKPGAWDTKSSTLLTLPAFGISSLMMNTTIGPIKMVLGARVEVQGEAVQTHGTQPVLSHGGPGTRVESQGQCGGWRNGV